MILNQKKILGTGIIVEIDESIFNTRKYNFGRCVRSVWVIGGFDENGDIFF
jgi:hypothetical protein